MAKRGQEITVYAALLNLDGERVTTGNVAAFVTADGTQAPATNTPAHEGNGVWSLELDESETTPVGQTLSVLLVHEDAEVVPAQVTVTVDEIEADLAAIQQTQGEQGDVLVEIKQQTSLIADAGGVEVTLTCRDVNGNPLAGVVVWLTTSNEPSPASKGQRTSDDFGIVKFVVTPGNYYVWQRAAGYQYTNPQQITVPGE